MTFYIIFQCRWHRGVVPPPPILILIVCRDEDSACRTQRPQSDCPWPNRRSPRERISPGQVCPLPPSYICPPLPNNLATCYTVRSRYLLTLCYLLLSRALFIEPKMAGTLSATGLSAIFPTTQVAHMTGARAQIEGGGYPTNDGVVKGDS